MHKKSTQTHRMCIQATLLTILNLTALLLADPLQENISHIANVNAHPYFVILWASSFSLYLLSYTPLIIKKLHYQNRFGMLCFYLSCFAMILSVMIPYQPLQYPFLADLHITLSMLSTLQFALFFLHLLYCGYFYNLNYTQQILPFYLCILGTCGMLYLLMGCVSTLLEVFFVIAMSWLLVYSTKNEKKPPTSEC